MKFKILLLAAPLLTLSAGLFAAAPVDSIGVENLNGKKVILHKLDPKETYYSLGRKYNVTPASIIQFNSNVALKVGNVVKVPTEMPFVTAASQPAVAQTAQATAPATGNASTNTDANVQLYKVSAGETLYAIAKRFNTTVDDIVKLNDLTSTNTSVGQTLKVKINSATPPPPAPVAVPVVQPVIAKRDSNLDTSVQDSANAVKFGANRYGLYEKAEKGIAVSMTDEGLDPSKKLALHATAPVGTVIKITNPMTGKTTFAKVVGRFTESEATKGAIIVVTKNVSDSIGALDKRVQVNISYGVPNE